MEIQTSAECKRRLPSGAVQVYPSGWTGDVDAATARDWIAAGRAIQVLPATAALTVAQTVVLAAAADEILAQAQQPAGEPSPLMLDDLTLAELKQVADSVGLAYGVKITKPRLIEALIAHREAQSASAEAESAASAQTDAA